MDEHMEMADAVPTCPIEPLLDERQAAERLGKDHRTLQNWRVMGKGPRYVKIGHSVRYPECWLLEWVKAQMVDPAERAA